MDVVGCEFALCEFTRRAGGGRGEAGACGVNARLERRGVGHAESGEEEAPCYACDWGEGEVKVCADEGVDEAVDNGDEDDEGDWVDVGEDVVWEAVELHLARWRKVSLCDWGWGEEITHPVRRSCSSFARTRASRLGRRGRPCRLAVRF